MNFKENGFEKIYHLISPDLANFCSDVLFLRYNAYKILKPLGDASRNFPVYEGLSDLQTTNAFSEYCSDIGDSLLTFVQSKVEEVVGEKLLPSYSYNRIYFEGSILEPHIDRPSCEISVTLNLSFTDEIWPIYFQDFEDKDEKCYEVMLNQGDGAVYSGSKLLHWREKLKKDNTNVQVFLHYVRENGQYSQCYYDGRRALGINYEKAIISGLVNRNQMNRDDISADELKKLQIVK